MCNKLRRNDGNKIKYKPSFCIFPSNLFRVIYEQIGSFVYISHKEGENYIYSKESIDNIISNRKGFLWFLKESKFKWRYPCSINNQCNKESFPYPAKAKKF